MRITERLTTSVSGRDRVEGRPEAAVTLLEYGDFECPACGEARQLVRILQERLGRRLRNVFRHFPLTDVHPHAERAAEAAEAAAAQGRFWAMHDALYENPKGAAAPYLRSHRAIARVRRQHKPASARVEGSGTGVTLTRNTPLGGE